jgi:hydrogenase-4 membrane subunit HyfE
VLDTVIKILALVMVVMALGIVSVGAIQHMIHLYRLQSLLLALLTMLIAFAPGQADLSTRILLGAFAVLIPGMLAYIIEPLLAQATVPRPAPWTQRLGRPFLRFFSRRLRAESQQAIREALPVWLEHRLSPSRQRTSAAISLVLTAIAYVVAFMLLTDEPSRAWDLAVAITLLTLGMFTTINRQDLISQILGLLVVDHGLFLAAVRVIAIPTLISIFVLSLFPYILITLVILVILLPELHAASETIEVADQKELRG